VTTSRARPAAPQLAASRRHGGAAWFAGGRVTGAGWLAAWLAVAVWLSACGGPARGANGEGGAPREPSPLAASEPPAPSRTAIDRRRDAACEQLGPKMTACAVDDARANLAAGKIDRPQFERDTAPAIQRKNTEEFENVCKAQAYSSRQVRVLEVCFREETRCGPLLDCLGHLSDAPGKTPTTR
jgi:hypothetical protein